MSQISTPKKRAYYAASETETDRLLLWIPKEEMHRVVRDPQIAQQAHDDYPEGLEIDVSDEAFDEFTVAVGVSPEAITVAYAQLNREELPESGIVDGDTLERLAQALDETGPEGFRRFVERSALDPTTQQLPEPEMSEGEDPVTFMRSLE